MRDASRSCPVLGRVCSWHQCESRFYIGFAQKLRPLRLAKCGSAYDGDLSQQNASVHASFTPRCLVATPERLFRQGDVADS